MADFQMWIGRRTPWAFTSALTVIPFTAILHHAVFFRPNCMLNKIGADYSPDVILAWLSIDPSPLLALAAAIAVWMAGLRFFQISIWVASFIIAFLPLSIWIWDIPFTGRIICTHFHDGRTFLHSRHFYILGFALWIPIAIGIKAIGSEIKSRPVASGSVDDR